MRIAFHTLGCKVNQYESEAMAQMFRARGHEIVGERDFADVYVINTCTVTAVADKKSRQYIRRMKKVNPDSIIAVTGCYAQISPDEVTKIKGVDIVTGTNEKHTLPDYVESLARAKAESDVSSSKAESAVSSSKAESDVSSPKAENVVSSPKAENAASPSKADFAASSPETNSAGPMPQGDSNGSSSQAGGPSVHILDYDQLDTYEDTGIVTSAENRTRAYIKIQEGCNRFCSYCVIPYARGNVRSRNLDEIVAEAKQLIEAGYKELVLTGINTALYGTERGPALAASQTDPDASAPADPTATPTDPAAGQADPATSATAEARTDPAAGQTGPDASAPADPTATPTDPAITAPAAPASWGVEPVIAAISELPGDFRIRLSSLEPAVVDAEYVRRLLKYEKLCHHLHLSAQSGSDRILEAMNRPYRRIDYLRIVETVRSFDPCYGISTDIIAGFPGETETDLRDSVSLVQICDFCRTHVFRYSRRPLTKAAEMKQQVSPQVKNRRSDELQKAGRQAQISFCMKNLGQRRPVLFEEYLEEEGMLTGYTDNYIRVYVRCAEKDAGELLNKILPVKVGEVYHDGCIALIL